MANDPTHDYEIRTTCHPDDDIEGLSVFHLEAITEDDAVIGTLEAVRYASFPFTLENDGRHLVSVFDSHSSDAAELADDAHKYREEISSIAMLAAPIGFIGITSIKVEPDARGYNLSGSLIEHLEKLHEGMEWIVGLHARPTETSEDGNTSDLAMQERLAGLSKSSLSLEFDVLQTRYRISGGGHGQT